jgi:hypothetical protein
MGDFKVGVSVGVYCTKCTLNTGVNTNFEITHCTCHKVPAGFIADSDHDECVICFVYTYT